MWFKNLKVFTFTKPFKIDAEKIEEQMQSDGFVPCTTLELSKMGWVSPLGKSGQMLTHVASGNLWFNQRKEEKILPSAVIKDALDEKVAELEEKSGTPLTKRQKSDIKEEIIHQLLPKAFSKFSHVQGYISEKHQWIVIDAGSDKKAEDCLALLRKSLGSFPVVPVQPSKAVTEILTHWVVDHDLPVPFVLENEAEFKYPGEDGGIIKCKNQDLTSDEISAHIEADKQVTQLRITWDETLSCTLAEDASVKRMRFTDVVKEQNEDITKEDMFARLDADFTLMTGEVNRFLESLFNVFQVELVNPE